MGEKSAIFLLWILASVAGTITLAPFFVAVPYSDQWTYWVPLLTGKNAAELFLHPHGPHRMGLGLWLEGFFLSLFAYDARVSNYLACLLLAILALLVVFLVRRQRGAGKFNYLLLLLFLSPLHWELLVSVPNISHGILPVLILVSVCLTIRHPLTFTQGLLVSVLLLSLFFTGFGMLLAPVFVFSLVIASWRFRKIIAFQHQRAVLIPIIATTLLSLALFFQDYELSTASDCEVHTDSRFQSSIRFFFMVFNRLYGIYQESGLFFSVGAVVTVSLIASSLVLLLQKPTRETFASFLTGSSFLLSAIVFVGAASVGRACGESLGHAHSGRYAIFAVLLLVSASLGIAHLRHHMLRLLGPIALSVLILFGFVRSFEKDVPKMRETAEIKRTWLTCLQRETYEMCRAELDAPLSPAAIADVVPLFRDAGVLPKL